MRIVVTDNDGGAIFSFLPQATNLDRRRFEQLFGTPHGTDFSARAAAHLMPFTQVGTPAQLAAQVKKRGPRMIHVRSNRHANVAAHADLNTAVCAAVGLAMRGAAIRGAR